MSYLYQTNRPIAEGVENLIQKDFKALDHGFVRVIDYMGNDNAIVQAARVSYGKGTKQKTKDRGLIRYLMRHWHSTPFEMCEIKFHIKLPIFIARQWVRHRTANINEYSARYSVMDKEFYIPDAENIAPQSMQNTQGRGDNAVSPEEARQVMQILQDDAARCYGNYQKMLNQGDDGQAIDDGKSGISRELARMNLTLNSYTQWYWKIDLHNLLHFLRLRCDSHAQYEIRVYADIIADIVSKWVPDSFEAFNDYRVGSMSLSRQEIEVIKRMLKGEAVTQEDSGVTKREWEENISKLIK